MKEEKVLGSSYIKREMEIFNATHMRTRRASVVGVIAPNVAAT